MISAAYILTVAGLWEAIWEPQFLVAQARVPSAKMHMPGTDAAVVRFLSATPSHIVRSSFSLAEYKPGIYCWKSLGNVSAALTPDTKRRT